MKRKPKLTGTMWDQLLNYLLEIEIEGKYYGNKHQYWKRHAQIVEWLKSQVEELPK